jgi:hypothetical protein
LQQRQQQQQQGQWFRQGCSQSFAVSAVRQWPKR